MRSKMKLTAGFLICLGVGALLCLGASLLPLQQVGPAMLTATPWEPISGTNATLTTASPVVLASVDCGSAGLMSIDVINTGATLTGLTIWTRNCRDCDFFPYLEGTDFQSTTNPNMRSAGVFTTATHAAAAAGHLPQALLTGETARIDVRVNGAEAVKITANTATTTSVTVKGQFKTGG